MDKNLKQLLKTYKELSGIILKDTNIDNILGIGELNLQPYVWKPYLVEEEEFLQRKLKDFLLKAQKDKYNCILTECVFREYKHQYILVSYIKENDNKDYTHILITIYDAYKNYLKTLKRKLTRRKNEYSSEYSRFKLVRNAVKPNFSYKFDKMGLYNNRGDISQTIYTQRFLPMIYFINNNPTLTTHIQGHHIFYNTKCEENSGYSILPIREDKHTQEFHPTNIQGSAESEYNIAKGLLYSEMLKLKSFKVKPKKYNPKVHANIFDILDYYFVKNMSVSDIERKIKATNPTNKLVYNTINSIVEHFKQYLPVLTLENIQHIKNIGLS